MFKKLAKIKYLPFW